MTRKCRLPSCRAPLPKLKDCLTAHEKANYCAPVCKYAHEREKAQAAPQKPQKAVKSKKRPKSIAKLRNEVADLLQKLVRMKAADSNGYVQCVTCPEIKHWKEMHGGHFIERGKASVKLLEENIHPQCPGCNTFRMKYASTVLIYRRYMVDMYGEDFVQWLESEAKQTRKHTRAELEQMKAEVRARINELEQSLTKAG